MLTFCVHGVKQAFAIQQASVYIYGKATSAHSDGLRRPEMQGANALQALDVVAALINFSHCSNLKTNVPSSADGSSGGSCSTVVARTLSPPTVSVAGSLRKVIDTLGSSARRGRRATKLMPFLATDTTFQRPQGK